MEFFINGLSPPGLKQKAHQFLIENPPATWQELKDHIVTKDLSFAISSEFIGTASSSIDNKLEIEGKKDQLKELTGLMKDHKKTQHIIHMSIETNKTTQCFATGVACQGIR